MKKFFIILTTLIIFCAPSFTSARDVSQITDWYIKDFKSEITVNLDSSLNITENIIADAGNLPDKHGIFRILPTVYYLDGGKKVNLPLKIISVTDFSGRQIKYQKTESVSDNTLTLKIGDPNRTVHGENQYQIKYQYQNAVRFSNQKFDELYFNLNGNFWQLETDNFEASIILPEAISQSNSEIYLYAGEIGAKIDDSLASFSWSDNGRKILVKNSRTLMPREGITISVSFPKNIISPYQPSFWEKYGQYFNWLAVLIPLFALFFVFKEWQKYGRDPRLNKTVIAEYEPPMGLSPMAMGMILNNSYFKNNFISATLVDLAVKGFIKIEELPKEGLFGKKDYQFILNKTEIANLKTEEKIILEEIFGSTLILEEKKKLSELKNKFYKKIEEIKKTARERLVQEDYFGKKGFARQVVFLIIGVLIATVPAIILMGVAPYFSAAFAVSGLLIFAFSFFMPQLTQKGAETVWQIKGFRLYMTTAEKYRQQFFEKENIFEKLLPYAMIFGLTELWIKKMKEIYGENYFQNYHPAWFYGATLGSFNADSFNSAVSSLSVNMNSALASSPSSSGGGGGGFSGGGGGGGGGGGW